MASPQTIQPAIADTSIFQANPTSNYGSLDSVYVAAYAGDRRKVILKFDFSAVVPAGQTITLATLSLYCSTSRASRTITVYRLLRTDWAETQATYNIYKTGSDWGTAGAYNSSTDFTTTGVATATSVAASNWLNETVTVQVQTALDSVSGIAHFLLVDEGTWTAGQNIYNSDEYATANLRPKLYIEYAPPWTDPTGINIGDAWKVADWPGSKLNVGDAWKAVRTVKVNISDVWKRVYSSPAILNEDATYILLESGTDDRIEVE